MLSIMMVGLASVLSRSFSGLWTMKVTPQGKKIHTSHLVLKRSASKHSELPQCLCRVVPSERNWSTNVSVVWSGTSHSKICSTKDNTFKRNLFSSKVRHYSNSGGLYRTRRTWSRGRFNKPCSSRDWQTIRSALCYLWGLLEDLMVLWSTLLPSSPQGEALWDESDRQGLGSGQAAIIRVLPAQQTLAGRWDLSLTLWAEAMWHRA